MKSWKDEKTKMIMIAGYLRNNQEILSLFNHESENKFKNHNRRSEIDENVR
jgi:hypothetical protein